MKSKRWQAVESLYRAALEREPAQRRAFLTEACGGDEELLHEVESLLAYEQPGERFLEGPALELEAQLMAADEVEKLLANHDKSSDFLVDLAVGALTPPAVESHLPSLAPGTLLAGRFKILRFAGEGGMGEVYEAEDLELHERLAVKILRSEVLQQTNAIERFKREVHLARKVTHPNVCRVFDLFRDKSNESKELVFVTMEFLRGETLADRLKRQGRMNIEEALPVVAQVASALGAAHQAGIVHRDFKPGNVVLVDETWGLRAVVTDFGLAYRAMNASREHSLSLSSWRPITSSAEFYGTPVYMAPEQIEGHPATAASDIYALGLVIYELVTGTRPFSGSTPMASAVKRLVEDPPKPRKFNPTLSPACESAILKCLERDPTRRFASPQDVADALVEDVDVNRGKMRREPAGLLRGRQARQRADRGRWRLMITAAAAIALVSAAVTYRLHTRSQSAHVAASMGIRSAPIEMRPAVAVLGFKNLSGRPDADWLSTALSETLTTELAIGEKLRTIPGENVARARIELSMPEADSYGQDTLARLRKNINTDFVVLGSYLDTGKESGGKLRLDLRLQDARTGETTASVSESGTEANLLDLILRTGAELREKLGVGEMTPSDLDSVRASLPSEPAAARLYAEGLKRLRVSDAAGARDLLKKAIATEPNYALAHSALADAWLALGYDENAKIEGQKAFDLSANLPREERLWVEARLRQTTRQWNKAVDLYSTLFNFFPDNLEYGLQLANAQRLAGKSKDGLVTIEALRRLPQPTGADPKIDLTEARIAQSLGDFKRQQAAARIASEKAEAIGASLLAAAARLEECAAVKDQGQFAEALTTCIKAKETYAATGDHHGLAIAMLRMGLGFYYRGDLVGAQSAFEQALANARQIGDNLNSAAALNNLAMVLSARGDHAGAKAQYLQSLAVNKQINRTGGIQLVAGNIAEQLAFLGDLDEARTEFLEVLRIVHEMGQEDSEALDLIRLGDVLHRQGSLGESEKMLNQALEICRRIGSKQICADALASRGDLLKTEGSLDRARMEYQEALMITNDVGDEIGAAGNQISIAELSVEEGHGTDAEPIIRKSREVFRGHQDIDNGIRADAMLARALLAQGKSIEASKELDPVAAQRLQNEEIRLEFSQVAALVRAASGNPSDQSAAIKMLEAMLAEAAKHGYLGYAFEARLALGEIEVKSGRAVAGPARLRTLAKDARAKGFLLIARKAASAAKG